MAAPAPSAVVLNVVGVTEDPGFERLKATVAALDDLAPGSNVKVQEHADKAAFDAWWASAKEGLGFAAMDAASPVSYTVDQFVGGVEATLTWIRKNIVGGAPAAMHPVVVHDNDLDTSKDSEYDYDLVVIGGGSGGLACSKAAAAHGARVACLDFVTPSPAGTKWGLGGTCVNVGCIPKKLMHTAALLGEFAEDSAAYGWKLGAEEKSHSWEVLREAVAQHIASLNFGYRVQLRGAEVTFKNELGSFISPHELETRNKKGKRNTITSRRFVIAVGGRPRQLDIPGGEHAVTSDDIFQLKRSPGKTLVVGASYVALECAGFLTGIGFDTTVMVRSILLRGFDRDMADKIGDYMKTHGTKFIEKCVPTSIEKQEDGKLKVSWAVSGGGEGESKDAGSDVYDTVLVATGRVPATSTLNLDAAGVKMDSKGKIITTNNQTSTPHIYAIGDVESGGLELTPVAIMAGKLLANRLFGKSTEGMDQTKVATTVFTPLEYGAVGLSEEDARAKYGDANIDVYHTSYTILEWFIPEGRPDNGCYVKVIVNLADNERVVGLHVLSPNAAEITQGWAAAVRMGATFKTISSTVGIHPSSSEVLTTLNVTKSSGESAEMTGC